MWIFYMAIKFLGDFCLRVFNFAIFPLSRKTIEKLETREIKYQ